MAPGFGVLGHYHLRPNCCLTLGDGPKQAMSERKAKNPHGIEAVKYRASVSGLGSWVYGSSTFCTSDGCVAEFRAAYGLLELLSSTLGLDGRTPEAQPKTEKP